MGFDCTLHVVDEKRIRDGFVPRLLGRSDERRPFDEREDADALWTQVRELLAGSGRDADSAGRAANSACQLAIAYCAAELPYHYERGFCLSLWPQAESPEAVPGELLDDPEGLFTELVAEHPALAGRFPLEIESNFSPGCFASAENVPALLEWVERRVQALSEGDRRPFRGLLLVLKEAASRGLAYWEGTDLPVPMMVTIRPPADLRRADLEEHPSPEGIHLACVGRADPIVAFAHGLGFPKDCRTAFADLTAWPPSFSIAGEYALSAARSRGGRWVTASMTPDRPYLYRVRVADRPDGAKTLLLPPDERENGIKWADFLGESVVAVLDAKEVYPEKTLLPALLLIEQDGRLAPLEGFPPIAEKFPTFGVVHLDEGDVLIWGGDGYERRGAGFEKAFALGAKWNFFERWATTPFGPDGFFHLSQRQLFHARRGQEPIRHLPSVENLMQLQPGPPGGVLIQQGDNKHGDLGKLYFPEEGTFLRIRPDLFADEDPDEIRSLHWAASSGRLVAATPQRLWAVPIERVLDAPRHRASDGRKIRKPG